MGDQGLILGREDPLEKGMATHSSILAWRIPRTEEPCRLQSMGVQRVGHNELLMLSKDYSRFSLNIFLALSAKVKVIKAKKEQMRLN